MKFHDDGVKGKQFMRLNYFTKTRRLQTDGWMDRQTDRVIPVYPPPPNG